MSVRSSVRLGGSAPTIGATIEERVFNASCCEANTASSQRAPRKPFDDDHDGEFDEDPYDDLDGDGHITWMRKKVERDVENPGLAV